KETRRRRVLSTRYAVPILSLSPCLPVSLSGLRQTDRDAEPRQLIGAVRRAAETVRRSTVAGVAAPRTAAQYALVAAVRGVGRAGRVLCGTEGVVGVAIGTPLVEVAVHVVQTPRVRRELLHRRRPTAGLTPGSGRGGRVIAVAVGQIGRDGIAGPEGGRRVGATGVFPFRLGRETVGQPLLRTQLSAKFLGVVPGDGVDRQVVAEELAGVVVLAHDRLPLLLTDKR